jgi:hypothetical protein
MRRLIVAALVAATAVVAVPSVASGGIPIPFLVVELASTTAPLTFEIEVVANFECNDGSIEIVQVEANDVDVTASASLAFDEADPNVAFITLPSGTTPGDLDVAASCTTGSNEFEESFTVSGDTVWAALAVTKSVAGPAPTDATFTVNVDCVAPVPPPDEIGNIELSDDYSVDLQFGAAGGVGYVYGDHDVDCTITEPVTGGAASTTIEPANVSFREEQVALTATVTNTFPEPAPEPAPAVAAVIQPTFTG